MKKAPKLESLWKNSKIVAVKEYKRDDTYIANSLLSQGVIHKVALPIISKVGSVEQYLVGLKSIFLMWCGVVKCNEEDFFLLQLSKFEIIFK